MRTNHGCDPPPFPSRSQRIKYFHVTIFCLENQIADLNSAISRSLFSAISLIVWKAISIFIELINAAAKLIELHLGTLLSLGGVGQVARPLTQHV